MNEKQEKIVNTEFEKCFTANFLLLMLITVISMNFVSVS